MIRDVFLYGRAGRQFGRHFRLDVASPSEAVRALIMLRPGLRELIRSGIWRVIVGRPHIRNGVAVDALGMNMGAQPLHLVAVARPRGGDDVSIGKIIVGVVLIGTALITAGGSLAALGTTYLIGSATSVVGVTAGAVAAIGVSMVLAGISGLIIQPIQQKALDNTNPLDAPSFVFNGVRNNTQAGGPIPLVYGTMLTGTVTVSTSIQITDIPQWYT